MTTIAERDAIRTKAEELGWKYRITDDGEVHFYGQMPNSNVVGWWLYAQSIDDAIAQIDGRAPSIA